MVSIPLTKRDGTDLSKKKIMLFLARYLGSEETIGKLRVI
jgi:hypothetical protein